MRKHIAALLLAAAAAAPAWAQDYPSRPITMVVPFPPGGIADLTARPFAPALEKQLKQPVVIQNKQGAAGAVGMQSVAIAPPDGYTVMVALVSVSTIPEVDALFGRTPAFTRDQFAGIARLNADPPMLVVNAERPWKSVKDIVEDAKKQPGQIVYSSSGVYGASHVPFEMFLDAAGIKMRHLPTTGGNPAMTAVLGNHAGLWASPPGIATPHLKAGKIRALAVWGDKRLADFPDVPTFKEQGYNVEYYLWAALFAPKGTPQPIVDKLRQATAAAVKDPDVVAAMAKINTPIAYLDAPAFKQFWDKDAANLATVIKKIGKVEEK